MSVSSAEIFTYELIRPIGIRGAKVVINARAAKLPTTPWSEDPNKVPNQRAVYIEAVVGVVRRMRLPLRVMDVRYADLVGRMACGDLLPSELTQTPPLVGEIEGRDEVVVIGDREVDVSIMPEEYLPQPPSTRPVELQPDPTLGILATVRDQAANGRHDIRSVASFDGKKFLTTTELPLPFKDQFTWCPTISNKVQDEVYLYHKFETALMLAGPKVYSYPEVEELREKMIRDGRLNIPKPANPVAEKLIFIAGGKFQTIEIDFGLSQLKLNELSRRIPGRSNNHGRVGLPNYVHVKSTQPGRSEWFSLDVDNEEGGSFEDRITEYRQALSVIIDTVCSPRIAPEVAFNVSSRRIPEPRLAVLNGTRTAFF